MCTSMKLRFSRNCRRSWQATEEIRNIAWLKPVLRSMALLFILHLLSIAVPISECLEECASKIL